MEIRYCLNCGKELEQKDTYRYICPHCDFHLFVSPIPSNSAIITNQKNEILLVERKVEPKKGFWDLPGGFINVEETVEESLEREIEEELGVKIANKKFFGSYPDRYLYKGTNYYTIGMIYEVTLKDGPLKPADDISTYKFFGLHEIPFDGLAFESNKVALRDYLKKLVR